MYSKESSEKHKMSNGVEGLVPLDFKIYFMVSKVNAKKKKLKQCNIGKCIDRESEEQNRNTRNNPNR